MKGWEIYAKDWGCMGWDVDDDDFFHADKIWLNTAVTWYDCGTYTLIFAYFRQPTPVQVLVDERRLRNQIKLMQDQWRRALYDPTRAVCRKRIEAEFRDLSEQEDRIGCNDA